MTRGNFTPFLTDVFKIIIVFLDLWQGFKLATNGVGVKEGE